MGKLKEKLKPEKLAATFPAYIGAYLMCMVMGFCALMFVRELLYQLDMMRYYGLGNFGGVASAFLCVLVCAFFFYQGAKIIISRAHRKSKKELKHPNGLYGMPIEICTAIYFVAEMFLLCMSISLGEYAYIGMLGAAVLMHFCENIVQRKDRGLLTRGSLYEKVHTAAQKAGIVIPFMVGCSIVSVLLFLFIVILIASGRGDVFYWGTMGSTFRLFLCGALAILIPCTFWYLCWCFHKLKIAGEALRDGLDGYRVDTSHMVGALREHGEDLNRIGEGVNKAVEERLKSERLRTELITNVSHDIKTPLTSIINYVDLITKEKTDNPNIQEYAEVLGKQSQKLKRLIENLIEASKASTGNIHVEIKPCNLNVLLAQISGEYEQRLAEQNLTLIASPLPDDIFVLADGSQLWRVFDNLLGNICKYALENTRVYMDVAVKEHDQVEITLKNISKNQLNLSEDELFERFKRGDNSRSTSGNGLGLSIAQSLMRLQNGSLHLVTDGDLFKAVVALNKTEPSSAL